MTMIYKFISSHSPHQCFLKQTALAAGLAEAEQNGRTGQRGDHREVQWPNHWAFVFPIVWVKWAFCLNKMCHKKRKEDSFGIISSIVLCEGRPFFLFFTCCSLMCLWCTFHRGSRDRDAGKSPPCAVREKIWDGSPWKTSLGSDTFPTMLWFYALFRSKLNLAENKRNLKILIQSGNWISLCLFVYWYQQTWEQKCGKKYLHKSFFCFLGDVTPKRQDWWCHIVYLFFGPKSVEVFRLLHLLRHHLSLVWCSWLSALHESLDVVHQKYVWRTNSYGFGSVMENAKEGPFLCAPCPMVRPWYLSSKR